MSNSLKPVPSCPAQHSDRVAYLMVIKSKRGGTAGVKDHSNGTYYYSHTHNQMNTVPFHSKATGTHLNKTFVYMWNIKKITWESTNPIPLLQYLSELVQPTKRG